ncbi:cyclic nucleotide-binding domain protein (macronuclear) [Tetrahymena thermophila SB210]|uniref:Cyclic nucleotide-binding domain protein n=1 Tax=Tetrahymena thermophila (strain SB210) TaxID=312017 RepID=I7MAI1_TETTS|nr:cyclic nucleotide-binding domain protein [Tetrahymena thermophila SB210]EAS04641.2 cyclic nucleotide-binding domain protein [Tetrahymena thermophila SB210]|eukprot:XP_001024886.2 cyclic nucleotide-binding domain protein [Tetrahymena thermophila SB210]
MITVGYGDIRPTNVIEVSVCIFLMMTCCVIFGFTINSIGQIFQDFYSKENLIRQKRFIIGNYMMRKGVTKSTMKEIYQYLDYYWKEKSDENQQEEQEIICQLSNRLRENLLTESYHDIFKQNSIFKDNFSYQTMQKCLPLIQEQRCTPEEIVYNSDVSSQDVWIYFVQSGELEVYIQPPNSKCQPQDNSSTSTVSILRKGDHFGEFSFFSGQQPKMNLKSLSFSKLIKIKRSDFLRILIEDQEEYETFCMIKDMILLQKDGTRLKVKCISCKDYTHEVGDCPYLHLQPNKYKAIGQMSLSQPHVQREKPKLERHLKTKQNTLKLIEINANQLLEFLNDKYENLINYEDNYLRLNYVSHQNSQFSSSLQKEATYSYHNMDNLTNQSNPFYNNQQLNQNSNLNITYPNRLSVSSGPQLYYQNSSFLNQMNSDQMIKPQEGLNSQRFNTFQTTETDEQYDNTRSNEDIQEIDKIKQISGNIKRPSYFGTFQQMQSNFSRTCSIQSQLPQENNQQIQLVSKQVAPKKNSILANLNNGPRKNSQQLYTKQLVPTNNNQFQKKMTKFVTGIPSQVYDDFIKKQVELKINKIDYLSEQFDLFEGDFEKMKITINYFSNFNYSKIILKLKKMQNIRKKTVCKPLEQANTRNILSKSQKYQGSSNSQNIFESNKQNFKQESKFNQNNSNTRTIFAANNHKIVSQSIFYPQSNNEKQLLSQNQSLSESKQLDLSQNVDKFITQESNDYSFSKINPNTPYHSSQDFNNFKIIQSTQNRKCYDFQ